MTSARRRWLLAGAALVVLAALALLAAPEGWMRPPPVDLPAPTRPEVAALTEALAEPNPPGIRAWAAGLLGELSGEAREEATPYLTAALEDPDPAVRQAARDALARGD